MNNLKDEWSTCLAPLRFQMVSGFPQSQGKGWTSGFCVSKDLVTVWALSALHWPLQLRHPAVMNTADTELSWLWLCVFLPSPSQSSFKTAQKSFLLRVCSEPCFWANYLLLKLSVPFVCSSKGLCQSYRECVCVSSLPCNLWVPEEQKRCLITGAAIEWATRNLLKGKRTHCI